MAGGDAQWVTRCGLTQELARQIIEKSSKGVPLARAARSLGVTPARWVTWRRLADQGDSPFAQFFERAQRAESILVDKALDVIEAGLDVDNPAGLDTKLACWVIERQMPQEFHPNTRAVLKATLNGLVVALRSEFANEPQLMQRIMTAMTRAQEIDADESETITQDSVLADIDAATTH
jgi:hypothetical protein